MKNLPNRPPGRQDALAVAITRLAEQLRLARQARAARKLIEIVERQRREECSK